MHREAVDAPFPEVPNTGLDGGPGQLDLVGGNQPTAWSKAGMALRSLPTQPSYDSMTNKGRQVVEQL